MSIVECVGDFLFCIYRKISVHKYKQIVQHLSLYTIEKWLNAYCYHFSIRVDIEIVTFCCKMSKKFEHSTVKLSPYALNGHLALHSVMKVIFFTVFELSMRDYTICDLVFHCCFHLYGSNGMCDVDKNTLCIKTD